MQLAEQLALLPAGENVTLPLPLPEMVSLSPGVLPALNLSAAALTSIRGVTMPLRLSVTIFPVLRRAARMSSTEAPGALSRITAMAPATCGAAIDVPCSTA